jgi:hypothetical protein
VAEAVPSETQPTSLIHTDEYNAALGRFVSAFAGVEGMVFALLTDMVGVSYEVGQAVFSGVRIDAAMDHIRRLCHLRHPDLEKPALEEIAPAPVAECLPRIAPINKVRNSILHYGVLVDQQGLPYTVNVRAPLPGKPRVPEPVPLPMLDDMTADLRKIETTLLAHLLLGKLPDEMLEGAYGEALRSAWCYTPRPPNSPDRKGFGSPQGRKRRPPA